LGGEGVQTMNSHFYMTIPSDSSVDYCPNNTVGRFVTKLPEHIRLEGDYEMGLAEFIYPHSWYNVDNKDWKYWIAAVQKVEEKAFPKIFIQSGYYEDGSAFADELNRECHRAFDDLDIKFSYSETLGRFSLAVHLTGAHLFGMSEDLQRYMGFGLRLREEIFRHDGRSGIRRKSRTEPHVRLLRRGVSHGRRRHKNTAARVWNVTGKHGDVARYTYDQPHYVPVGRREFDTIEVAINNELGKPMSFEYGKSVVILHFRRRRW
jgi:hypothetical protein